LGLYRSSLGLAGRERERGKKNKNDVFVGQKVKKKKSWGGPPKGAPQGPPPGGAGGPQTPPPPQTPPGRRKKGQWVSRKKGCPIGRGGFAEKSTRTHNLVLGGNSVQKKKRIAQKGGKKIWRDFAN